MTEKQERPEDVELDRDPMAQFGKWLQEAQATDLREPTAMTLTTCSPRGGPSARIVLLKEFGPEGFVFFTNYESRKGLELEAAPEAALLFHWDPLARQVRISGRALRIEPARSDTYFTTRDRIGQLGAWASPQSRPISGRRELEERFADAQRRFEGGPVPRPPHWGGYCLHPDEIEFWIGRPGRLHDRFLYRRDAGGDWLVERLAP